MAIDETLAEAHAVLGFAMFWYEWDWRGAEKHLKQALALDSESADAYWMCGHVLFIIGRHGEALAAFARARELDPLSGLIHAMEGQFLLYAGRLPSAIARLKEAIALDPRSRVAHLFLSSAYIEQGCFDQAMVEASVAHALCPSNSSARTNQACAHALAGRQSEALEILSGLLNLATTAYVPGYNIALIYNALGQIDEALIWLETGCDNTRRGSYF